MKICHVSNYLPDLHHKVGGAEQAVQRIIQLENQNKIDTVVVTSAFEKKYKKEKNKRIYGIPTIEKYIGKLGTFLKLIVPFDGISYFHFKRILRKEKPNIVHIHNFDVLTFSIISAAKSLSLPVILSVYDYWIVCPTTSVAGGAALSNNQFAGALEEH